MEARNRALGRQLERVQDEERSELARDLHDEVSPFLFAVDVDAAAIQSISRNAKVTAKQAGQLAQRAAAIREATGHMKKHVRAILGQLRPEGAVALGLEEALLHLVQQIEERHPSVDVDLKVDASTFGTQLDATIHRLVREALSNALKHGTPARLSVRVLSLGERVDVEVVDDGGGMRKVSTTDSGFGLTGMQERIEALGGSFDVTDVDAPAGVRVHAVLPLRQERAMVEGALS
jgi:two-component system sensor histidine kinase UhpB